MHARSKQGVNLGAGRQRVRIDDLRLAALQRLDVAHHVHRKAHARSDMNPATSRRRQPFGLARFEIEQIHHRARYAEDFPQWLYRRRRDDLGGLGRRNRMVDLMQDAQAPGVLAMRLDKPPVEGAVLQQQHQQHQTRCHQPIDSPCVEAQIEPAGVEDCGQGDIEDPCTHDDHQPQIEDSARAPRPKRAQRGHAQ